MRLTVGPLPAAVYWRRRALVAGLLVLLVVMVSYACGGGATKAADNGQEPSPSVQPGQGRTPPTTASPTGGAVGGDQTPSNPPFSLPTSAVTGPCADAEMTVTATAPATATRGSVVALTITFRNVSTRSCARDIGADMQELRLMKGKELVWSSDDCNANTGKDPFTFAPNAVREFRLNWNGRVSRTGTGSVTCAATAPAPQIGAYDLYGRLGTKLSPAVVLRIT